MLKYVCVQSASPESKSGTKRSHRTTDFGLKQGWIFKSKSKNDADLYNITTSGRGWIVLRFLKRVEEYTR